MDNTLLTALIAAGSACIGALIPSLFSYLGKRIEYKNDRRAKMDEIRRKEYYRYIEALQTMINNENRDTFMELQASTNRILLFSGPKLSKKVNEYYKRIIKAAQGETMGLDELTKYNTDIINEMRKELNISNETLDSVDIVRAAKK